MKIWKKYSQQEIKERVFLALEKNVNYNNSMILGIPASHLDEKVFSQDHSFINDKPFISTLIQNPNHIGCHTLGESESFFEGTQSIEREVIDICAVDILKANLDSYDGYVASGGTEANLQAIWIYRNYFKKTFSCKNDKIAILCSEDSHYSMDKGADIFGLEIYKAKVDFSNRKIDVESVVELLIKAKSEGIEHFIVVCNMMTTMFGSVDDVDVYLEALKKQKLSYKIHVDGAFGGFYYPFSSEDQKLTFLNEEVTSFTLDAHKMAQAPYGTGIFIIRKGFMKFSTTSSASYVEGQDCTLVGSRSGANAVAIWMILSKNGPHGWFEKIFILQNRTAWMCIQLDKLKIEYFRHLRANIIAIRSNFIDPVVAKKYGLVPDNHMNPKWFKIVVMEHVTIEKLGMLCDVLKTGCKQLT